MSENINEIKENTLYSFKWVWFFFSHESHARDAKLVCEYTVISGIKCCTEI